MQLALKIRSLCCCLCSQRCMLAVKNLVMLCHRVDRMLPHSLAGHQQHSRNFKGHAPARGACDEFNFSKHPPATPGRRRACRAMTSSHRGGREHAQLSRARPRFTGSVGCHMTLLRAFRTVQKARFPVDSRPASLGRMAPASMPSHPVTMSSAAAAVTPTTQHAALRRLPCKHSAASFQRHRLSHNRIHIDVFKLSAPACSTST